MVQATIYIGSRKLGTFRYTIEISEPAGARFESVEAILDAWASYTVVPADLLQRLGAIFHDRVPFILADIRPIERCGADLGAGR